MFGKIIKKRHLLLKYMYQAMYFCVRGIDVASLCDCDIIFCNCSDNVAVFVFHFI